MNNWRTTDNPDESGWYQATVQYSHGAEVRPLYWHSQKWREPGEYEQWPWSEPAGTVLAWKALSKPYQPADDKGVSTPIRDAESVYSLGYSDGRQGGEYKPSWQGVEFGGVELEAYSKGYEDGAIKRAEGDPYGWPDEPDPND
jgi:hypothetical protein